MQGSALLEMQGLEAELQAHLDQTVSDLAGAERADGMITASETMELSIIAEGLDGEYHKAINTIETPASTAEATFPDVAPGLTVVDVPSQHNQESNDESPNEK